ncbi:DMT family transporter [Kallotenue papyrolyticum]|uniref:DMT family transporter n=1 Tax=Kallotenue papyrolyticum TaxID=1325125 RepID=UPI000492454B|nr:DMT family transporter [Kallotenue papyrolyticum]
MRPKQLATLLLLAAIWGASFLLIKLSVRTAAQPGNFPPATLVMIRLGIAGLVLLGLLRLRGARLDGRCAPGLAVLGLINAALPYALFSWGGAHIDSNLAAIYNATTPLFTVLLALLFVREERLSALRTSGVVIGFLGIVYLFGGSATRSAERLHLLGELAAIGASFCYGLGNMWTRRRLRGLDPLQLATGQLLFGALWTVPLVVLVEQPWRSLAPTSTAVLALGTLTLLGTACAQVLFFALLTQVGATRTAQVTYLLPIFGIFWGWLAGETIASRALIAFAIVLGGVLIVNGALDRGARRTVAVECAAEGRPC